MERRGIGESESGEEGVVMQNEKAQIFGLPPLPPPPSAPIGESSDSRKNPLSRLTPCLSHLFFSASTFLYFSIYFSGFFYSLYLLYLFFLFISLLKENNFSFFFSSLLKSESVPLKTGVSCQILQ
jgi:hypothetical protein